MRKGSPLPLVSDRTRGTDAGSQPIRGAEAIGLLKEMVVQAEALVPYGVQEDTIYAVKRQIEEMEEKH